MRSLSCSFALALVASCTTPPPSAPAAGAAVDDTCPTVASEETVRVFEAMEPHCIGCHAEGERGFFASADAFQSLIVADARYVTPGNPDDSELVRLLLGSGTRAFTQMPISGPTYAELVDEGDATLTVDEVRAWITALPAQARSQEPDKDAVRVTRVSATQLRRALHQQLGLSNEDFFIPAFEFGIEMAEARSDDLYPLLSPDEFPAPRQRITEERHFGLGGASFAQQTRADRTTSPNFVNNLVQLSQRWCRLSIEKAGNTALFPSGQPPAGDDAAAVKDTLRRWSRHFHAVELADADVDELYETLFLSLRADAAADALSPWAGTCSYFVRHPNWIFF